MESAPASPNTKLLEEIFLSGTDTVIRISENAVLLTTNRAGGIQLPSNVKTDQHDAAGGARMGTTAEENGEDNYENLPQMDEFKEEVVPNADRLVTEEELRALAINIDHDWRTLAICQLDVPATEIESIMQQTKDTSEQKFFMFQRWKTRQEENATVGTLISAIDKHVGREKWGFLVGDEDGEPEGDRLEDHEQHEHENPSPGHHFDDDAGSETSSLESVGDLPRLSLVDQEKERAGTADTPPKEDRPLEIHGTSEVRDERPEEGRNVFEDIERVSAVYTGFAEDKKDEFTSIGSSLGDLLKKILTLDHENKTLKTDNKRLSEELKVTKAKVVLFQEQKRPEPPATPTKEECRRDKDGKPRCEDYAKLRSNYGKIKAHLKEAVEANREWETFSRNKRDKYQADMHEKLKLIKALEDKLEKAQSSTADVNRQMDSILNATEKQTTDISNELAALKAENKELRKELQQRTEEKRKIEKLSKELMKGGAKSPKKDRREVHREVRKPGDRESLQDLLVRAKTHTRAPPEEDLPGARAQATPTDDDITFLKNQILDYRGKYERERVDKEKATDDLESLRQELERAQLLLMQRGELPYGNYGGDRGKTGAKPKRFPYMDPEEVKNFRSHEHGADWPY